MAASKTGLPKYAKGDGFVFAARINEIVPYIYPRAVGAKTMRFSDSPKKVNLIGEWIAANNPVIGGYFVVEDVNSNTICRFVDANTFAGQYTPA